MLNYRESFYVYLQQIKALIKVLAFYLSIMTIFRLVFFFVFKDPSINSELSVYIAKSFILGFRFDLAVSSYMLILPLLLFSLAYVFCNAKIWKFIIHFNKYLLVVLSIVVFTLQLFNLNFYSYFQEHFNVLIYAFIEDDTVALIKTIWKNDPVIKASVGLMCFYYLIYYVHTRWLSGSKIREKFSHPLNQTITVLSFIILLFLGARGSLNFDMRPLNRFHTDISPNHFLNKMSYHAIYALKEAVMQRSRTYSSNFDLVKNYGYRGKESLIVKDFFQKNLNLDSNFLENLKFVTPKNQEAETRPPNVVYIVMESMGGFWLKFNGQAYPIWGDMQKHIKEDYLFNNFLPSGNGTFPSVTYSLMGIPELPGPNPSEKYLTIDHLMAAPRVFNENQYNTQYIYGGGLGWRNLTPFLQQIKFKEIHGAGSIKSHFKTKNLAEHDWGLHDEHMFDFIFDQLQKGESRPQFIYALSTTNHPPFDVPKSYKTIDFKYPEELRKRLTVSSGTLNKRLNAFKYSMDSLAHFVSKIKADNNLSENTIIAVTGDHSFYDSVQFKPEEIIDWRGVPLYLYLPKRFKQEIDTNKFASHDSILPTLYDLSLSSAEYYSMGVSLVRDDRKSFAINSRNIVDENGAIIDEKFYKRNKEHELVLANDAEVDSLSYLKKIRNSYMALSGLYLEALLKKENTKVNKKN